MIDLLQIPTDESFTTNQIEAMLNTDPVIPGSYSLTEENDIIYWNNQQILPHICWLYLPVDESFPDKFMPLSQESYLEKKIPIHPYILYRCQQSNYKWKITFDFFQFSMNYENPTLDLLLLEHNYASWIRYQVTPDPRQEDPALQEFYYEENNGHITITGVKYPSEILHIPAVINNRPVTNVHFSDHYNFTYLRELVLEQGISKLDIPWDLRDLSIISLPKSVTLVRVPHLISSTLWYKLHAPGPIYFCGYYCGTKGNIRSNTLNLCDGTIGIIEDADYDRPWEKVNFPSSLCYIGKHAFHESTTPETITFASGTKELKRFFNKHIFSSSATPEKRSISDTCAVLTSQSLYELAYHNPLLPKDISWQWLPLPPRLLYKEDWIAEYLFCTEDEQQVGYYVAIDIATGKPLKIHRLNANIPPYYSALCQNCWTKLYRTPFFLMSEDYLETCADIINKGAPSNDELAVLTQWWERLCPKFTSLLPRL